MHHLNIGVLCILVSIYGDVNKFKIYMQCCYSRPTEAFAFVFSHLQIRLHLLLETEVNLLS